MGKNCMETQEIRTVGVWLESVPIYSDVCPGDLSEVPSAPQLKGTVGVSSLSVTCSFFLGCQQLPSMFHVDHCETEGKAVQVSLWCHRRELTVGLFLLSPEQLFQKNQERQKRGRKLQWKPLIFLPIRWMVTSCECASIIKLFPSLTLPNPFYIPVIWGILSIQGFQMIWPTQLEQA